jgi:hypothetical protein
MITRGFITLTRGVLDHPVVGLEKPVQCFVAWVWLLQHAAYKPHRVRVSSARAYGVAQLERGQLSYSQSYLANAWGWTEKRVRTFLRRLVKEGQIAVQTDGLQSIITVCNYDLYQLPIGDRDGQTDGETDARLPGNGREEEKAKKDKKKITSVEPEGFSEWYEIYPRKIGRHNASRAYAKFVPSSIEAVDLLRQTVKYREEWTSRGDLTYCPHPATWLNGRRFLDHPESKAAAGPGRPAASCADFISHDQWLYILDMRRRGAPWRVVDWGPEPGQPGCMVPAHLLASDQGKVV